MPRGRAVLPPAAALAAVAVFAGLSLTGVVGERATLWVDDLGQLAAAATASVACALAARRSAPGRRRAWALISAGTGCWAVGQALWSVYELGPRGEVPFPSAADAGFLLFPVLAAAGLLSWLTAGRRAITFGRDLVDGVIIAGSLLALSWVTTLSAVYEAGGSTRLELWLSLAYPLTDVVLATLALLALARARPGERAALGWLAAGLGGLAVADSVYVYSYLTSADGFGTTGVVGVLWVLGFCLIAVAAAAADPGDPGDPGAPGGARRAEVEDGVCPALAAAAPTGVAGPVLGVALPYLPMVAAVSTLSYRWVAHADVRVEEVAMGAALIAAVLGRQVMAMTENRRLLTELAVAQQELRHRALHDPLTGLANRALFTDRVEHALAVRPEAGRRVAVLFCDLDDFKGVNDGMGHAAGDQLLVQVAQRLSACLRPADTVSRLGGDEFAVLLEDPTDPVEVADRVLAAVSEPLTLSGTEVHVTLSVGVAVHEEPAAEPTSAAALLHRADVAMYSAKAAGKGRVVSAGAGGATALAP